MSLRAVFGWTGVALYNLLMPLGVWIALEHQWQPSIDPRNGGDALGALAFVLVIVMIIVATWVFDGPLPRDFRPLVGALTLSWIALAVTFAAAAFPLVWPVAVTGITASLVALDLPLALWFSTAEKRAEKETTRRRSLEALEREVLDQ